MKRFLIAILLSLSLFSAYGQLNKPYFYTKGQEYIIARQYRQAIDALNMLLRSLPEDYEGYFLRGVAKYNLNDLQGAYQDFSKAINLNPVYTQAFQYRGIVQSRMGLYDEAIADFNRVLEMRPNFAGAYYSRAVTNFLNQQFKPAIDDYGRYIRLEPRDEQAFVNRGTAHLYAGDTTAAIRDYNQAIAINPYQPDGYLRRGLLALNRSKTKEAIEDLNRTIDLDSTYAIAYFYRALGNNTLGRLTLAIDDFDMAIRYDSTNSVSYFNRGLLRSQIGDYNRAIDDFTKVISVNPENVLVYYNRAGLYAQLGDLKRAAADYSRAIEIYPDFANAYLFRSQIKAMLGDRKGSTADRKEGEKIISQYRDKMTSESFDKYADTSARLNEIMSFNADFGNNEFWSVKVEERRLAPRTFFAFSLSMPDSTILDAQTKYGNRRIDDFIESSKINNLTITNREPNISPNYVLDRSTALQGATEWNELFEKSITEAMMSRYTASVDLLNYLVTERPDNPYALLNRGVVKALMVDFIASLEGDYQSRNLESADLASRLKKTGRIEYDYSEAVRDFNAVIALMPELPYPYFNLGNIYVAEKDLTKALQAYTKAIELYPYFADAYFNRGVVQIMLGEKQKGCLDLSKAGELGIQEAYSLLDTQCSKQR